MLEEWAGREAFLLYALTAVIAFVVIIHFGPWSRGGKAFPTPLLGGLPTSIFGRFGGHTIFLTSDDAVDRVENWSKKYNGKPYYLSITATNVAVISDEDEIRRVFNLRPTVFKRAPAELPEVLETLRLAPFLFASEGQEWSRYRRLTAPAFSARNVARALPSVHRVAQRLVSKWSQAAKDEKIVAALPDVMRTMHNVIALAGFGLDTHSLRRGIQGIQGGKSDGVVKKDITKKEDKDAIKEDQEVPEIDTYEALTAAFAMMDAILYMPWNRLTWDYLPWVPWVKKYKKQQRDCDSLLRSYIEQEKSRGVDPSDDRAEGVLLRNMIAALDASGSGGGGGAAAGKRAKLSDAELLYNLKGFFVAGTDTSSITLAWCFYYLAENQALQQKARKAVDSVPLPAPATNADGGSFNSEKEKTTSRFCTKEAMGSLRLLEAVVLEALRLNPAGPLLPFTNMQEVTVCGETFPPGWTFWLLLRLQQRSAENFAKPMEFVPERWLSAEERAEALGCALGESPPNHRPEAFFAFGRGPRVCPGKALALAEAVVILATVLDVLELSLAPNHGPPGEEVAFAVAPKKVNLVFKLRDNAINQVIKK